MKGQLQAAAAGPGMGTSANATKARFARVGSGTCTRLYRGQEKSKRPSVHLMPASASSTESSTPVQHRSRSQLRVRASVEDKIAQPTWRAQLQP